MLFIMAMVVSCCASLYTAERAFGAGRSIGAAGQGAGEFKAPVGIAISQQVGEAFIADRNNARVDAFNTQGSFLRAFGWGVASASEELQTCTTHCFAGIEGSGSGEFSFPQGLAVDNDPLSSSHGDVYVWDASNLRVQKLTPGGEFLLMFGGKVNASTEGDICAAGEACQAGAPGPGPGQFEATFGNPIAVDDSGTVYVGDLNRVQEFDPTGTLQGEAKLPSAGSIEQLAIDSAKHLYVKSNELTGVRKYDLTGKELPAPRDEGGSPGPLAIGAAGELFVADGFGHILRFDAEGKQLQSFGAGVQALNGIAYDQAEEAIFALGPSAVNVVPVPPLGPLVISESAEAAPTSATLSGVVNPEGQAQNASEESKFHFEYGETSSYGASTSPQPSLGENFEDRGVSAAISGLQPSTTYHFRVVATNAESQTTLGADQTFTTPPPVSIDRESVSGVSAFSARLQAELNPHGSPTEYHFQYGTTAVYETSVPTPDASAGEGSEDTAVSVPIQNLTPATTYHFRVVAHNAFGQSAGPDQTFTTQSTSETALIDGRAWEMVSPLDKNGVTFEAIAKEGDVIQAAEDGHAITYAATAPLTKEAEGNRALAYSQVLSARQSPGAWSSKDIATKHEEVAGLTAGELSEYALFSADLSTGIVEPHGATPLSEPPPGQTQERTPYRREANGAFTPLASAANVRPGVKYGGEEVENVVGRWGNGVNFIIATPDQSHVLLSSAQGLTPQAESGTLKNLFEWSAGALRLASVLPNGVPVSQEGEEAKAGVSDHLLRNALSSDGKRIVFEVQPNPHLYVRDMALGQTVQVDAAQAGLKEAGVPHFQSASSNGARVFFLDEGTLTVDSTARAGQPDLYECDITATGGKLACTLKDLTVDANLGESAGVLGVPGADESGGLVYFVANGRLAAGAVQGDCTHAQESGETSVSCNLYVRDTVTDTTRLAAVLSGADFRDWQPGGSEESELTKLTSRVSPSGQYLAFMSERPLTGFDNRDAKSGQRDEEVFEYSLGANTLTCVSCASSGARPQGVLDPERFPGLLVDRPAVWPERWLAASIPGWTSVSTNTALYQSRYLSDSGRMFFNSATPLVPSDANGLMDVYEYEPAGAGACDLSSGCVGLISAGGSSEESAFMDASADGSDVFFLSSARLSGSDSDNAYDIYDAHVCSAGSPCATEATTPPPPCATADACRAAPPPQPDIVAAPASQSFSGQGNPPPAEKPKPKPLTRAQKLAKALRACKKDKNKRKKVACVKRAKKLYGPVKKKAKKSPRGSARR